MDSAPLDPTHTVVVVGTSLAGLRAAETLRGEGFGGRLVMVGAEHHPPYDRPPLSKQYLARTWERDRLWLRPADKLDALDLQWRLGRRATGLDVGEQTVQLDGEETLRYDRLVVATGATPLRFDTGGRIDGVHVLRTIEDADALAATLTAGARVVVVGAGFIGCEVAATARAHGAAVTVVEPLPAPLARALGSTVGDVCAALHRAHGVDLRTGTAAVALRGSDGQRVLLDTVRPRAAPQAGAAPNLAGGQPGNSAAGGPVAAALGAEPAGTSNPVAAVELADGSVLSADVVVVGIGVTPAAGWLAGSGLDLDRGVVVDASLHAAQRVVAAGDVARWPAPGTGELVCVEHWTNASEQGVVAARSLLAGRRQADAYDPVPYVWSDQYDLKIQVIGLVAADDDVTVVDGSLLDGRFVALYSRKGTVTGAVGFGRPRQLMGARTLVQRRAPLADAMAAFGS